MSPYPTLLRLAQRGPLVRRLHASRPAASDALFVHRDADPNVQKFEFNEENLKVQSA